MLMDFNYLTSIYMSHNNVRSLPKSGVTLSLLDLSHNNLRKVPEEMREASVNTLLLNSNKLTSLEITPRSLISLDIANNYITEISYETSYKLPLKTNLDYNYLPCSQYSSYGVYFKRNCVQDKQYTCANKTLSECNDLKNEYGICTPNSKQTKCLRYTNGVKDFCDFAADAGIEGCMDIYPDDLCNGTSELHGFVYDCEQDIVAEYRPRDASTMFKEVPKGASKMVNLTTLNFSGLNLTAIPESYSNFDHVDTLNLTYNRFREIPSLAYALNSLVALDISHNKLMALPEDFFPERDLYTFYAHHNYLMNVSDDVYEDIYYVRYKNLDYNLLTCMEFHSRGICSTNRQFVCSQMDEEGCNLEIVKKCAYNTTTGKCVKYDPPHYIDPEVKKTPVVAIVVPVVVGFVLICVCAYAYVPCKLYMLKRKSRKESKLEENERGVEKHEKENEGGHCKMDECSPPKIAVVVAAPTAPGAPGVSIPSPTKFTPIALTRMDIAPNFYETSQPGLDSIFALFAPDEHMRRKDLMVALQQAGCDPSESQKIIQEVVIWAGKIRCTSSFTTHDAEVLGVYTYNYGDSFRMKSPAFKLCYAMNMLDETEIRIHKDFLYLALTSLRRLPFTNFGSKKLYFTMASMNASSANFPVGKTVKIMPFLTLFSNKGVALSTLSRTSGVIFEVSVAEGYDVTQYSIVNPKDSDTSEVIMEPESVFRIEEFKQVSENVAEVSLMYIREMSEFPLSNVIANNNNGGGNSVNADYNQYYVPSAPSAPSAPSNPYY